MASDRQAERHGGKLELELESADRYVPNSIPLSHPDREGTHLQQVWERLRPSLQLDSIGGEDEASETNRQQSLPSPVGDKDFKIPDGGLLLFQHIVEVLDEKGEWNKLRSGVFLLAEADLALLYPMTTRCMSPKNGGDAPFVLEKILRERACSLLGGIPETLGEMGELFEGCAKVTAFRLLPKGEIFCSPKGLRALWLEGGEKSEALEAARWRLPPREVKCRELSATDVSKLERTRFSIDALLAALLLPHLIHLHVIISGRVKIFQRRFGTRVDPFLGVLALTKPDDTSRNRPMIRDLHKLVRLIAGGVDKQEELKAFRREVLAGSGHWLMRWNVMDTLSQLGDGALKFLHCLRDFRNGEASKQKKGEARTEKTNAELGRRVTTKGLLPALLRSSTDLKGPSTLDKLGGRGHLEYRYEWPADCAEAFLGACLLSSLLRLLDIVFLPPRDTPPSAAAAAAASSAHSPHASPHPLFASLRHVAEVYNCLYSCTEGEMECVASPLEPDFVPSDQRGWKNELLVNLKPLPESAVVSHQRKNVSLPWLLQLGVGADALNSRGDMGARDRLVAFLRSGGWLNTDGFRNLCELLLTALTPPGTLAGMMTDLEHKACVVLCRHDGVFDWLAHDHHIVLPDRLRVRGDMTSLVALTEGIITLSIPLICFTLSPQSLLTQSIMGGHRQHLTRTLTTATLTATRLFHTQTENASTRDWGERLGLRGLIPDDQIDEVRNEARLRGVAFNADIVASLRKDWGFDADASTGGQPEVSAPSGLPGGPAPTSALPRGPPPTSALPRGPAPTSALPRDPPPTSALPRGPPPTSALPRDPPPSSGPAPTSALPRDPTSALPRGPAPTSALLRGPAPTSALPRDPPPTFALPRGPPPTSTLPRGPAPTSALPHPGASPSGGARTSAKGKKREAGEAPAIPQAQGCAGNQGAGKRAKADDTAGLKLLAKMYKASKAALLVASKYNYQVRFAFVVVAH
uniref:Uncharacterized protein n=1 Tax=Chromera velia CCMP2878 TaxID=1169474 RepID=A0A0G4GSA1_9ALVE|eukprot:Cvel_23169.t1-p1 / transcript=Cvel_23169.t1 / gene=Cvel_23169 / organism=Chromera_velia_CCMP2878 / gene_product=Basic proline-rich protein, putative / transcript_product=Basic proline-rich protein, putative / location=Cvel_scaffold2358:15426-19877(-) / protein_length=976 / sequence_SO=supercontig / SO=protein_coding / is_pseudo=false